MIPLFPSDI